MQHGQDIAYYNQDTGLLPTLVPWEAVVGEDPCVIGLSNGRLMTVMRYTCPDTEHLSETERARYLARVHTVLGAVQHPWTMEFDWRHVPAATYPESQWGHPVDWLVDEVRRLAYARDIQHESQAYLTLTWQPPQGKERWLRGLFLTQRVREFSRQQAADIEAFQGGVKRFAGLLTPLMVALEALDADATVTYLHQSVSWDQHTCRCPWPPTGLQHQIANTLFVPGQPPVLGHTSLQPLYVHSWLQEAGTWLPEMLEKLPFPARLHVRWQPLSPQGAAHVLKWAEKGWAGAYRSAMKVAKLGAGTGLDSEVQGRDDNDEAIQAGQSILNVRAEIAAGDEVLGWLTPTVLCWADDAKVLNERMQVLESLLFHQGLVVRREEAGASLGWLASLPGHTGLGFRGRALRTRELTAIMPHTSVWVGPERDTHLDGPPLLVASTDGTPFRLVTHYGEVGGVFLAGPTRAGKSGAIGLMVRQWRRYPGAKAALWDRDYALKACTVLGGGHHYTLGAGAGVGFQPLGALETEEDQRWALQWIEGILQGEGLPPDPTERQELWETVQRMSGLEHEQRTLSMFQRLMQVQRLKIGLEPFCAGGPYGYFDADHDDITLDADLVCFEMSAILGTRALGPAFAHTTRRLETQWFTGGPVALVLDEARWLLDADAILGDVEIWLKARAKKNVSVWLSTQELVDLSRTRAWHAILGAIKTRILLPNVDATSPALAPLYEEIGVTEGEREILAGASPLRDYLYKSPLGTRLFQLHLSPVERLLCAASRQEELAVLEEMQRTSTPEDLPAAWLRRWGYEEEASIIEEAFHGHTA